MPSTKLFEYAMSGRIDRNEYICKLKIYYPRNCVICEDTVSGFSEALLNVYDNLEKYTEEDILGFLENFS